MKPTATFFAIAVALSAATVHAQTTSYSLGNSTQGGFPSPPDRVDFGPAPPSMPDSDSALLETVSTALAADPMLRGARIDVVVVEGRVVLSGSALTDEQAAYARGLAAGVAGSDRVSGEFATTR